MARSLMADSAKRLAAYIPASAGNLALAQDGGKAHGEIAKHAPGRQVHRDHQRVLPGLINLCNTIRLTPGEANPRAFLRLLSCAPSSVEMEVSKVDGRKL